MKLIDLTEKIDKINDEIVGLYQTALRNAEIKKKSLEKLISKENNSIMSNERNLKKAKACLNDFMSDYSQLKDKIKTYEVNASNLEERIYEFNDIISAQQNEVEAAEKEFNESSDRSKRLDSNELEILKRVTKLRNDSEQFNQRLTSLRSKINGIDEQVLNFLFKFF